MSCVGLFLSTYEIEESERKTGQEEQQQIVLQINQHLRMLRSFPLLELIFDVIRDNFHREEDQYD